MARFGMQAAIRIGLTLALGSLGFGGVTLYGAETSAQNLTLPHGVNVSGEGRVLGRPDVAILRLGVSTRAASVGEAQTRTQQAMAQLLKIIKEQDIADRDIQTQQFNISPEYTQRPGPDQSMRIVGYRVNHILSVKVRKIENTGRVIDATTQAVGDALQVQGISLTMDDPTALRAQAREKAMLEAKSKADQLARLGGITLGKPLYISEDGMMPVPLATEQVSLAAAAHTPISVGEVEVSVRVQVTYAILP